MTLHEADKLALSKSCQGKKMSEMTVVGLGYVRSIFSQIFDEHEAQLKAKDKEINLLKYRHNLEHERYLINEKIIEEKDEEIQKILNENRPL